MDISLRKANALQAVILDAVNSLANAPMVSINVFEDIDEKLDNSRAYCFAFILPFRFRLIALLA